MNAATIAKRRKQYHNLELSTYDLVSTLTAKSYARFVDNFYFRNSSQFELIKQAVQRGWHKDFDPRLPGGGGIFLGRGQCRHCGEWQEIEDRDISVVFTSQRSMWLVPEVRWKCNSYKCITIRTTDHKPCRNEYWGTENTVNFPSITSAEYTNEQLGYISRFTKKRDYDLSEEGRRASSNYFDFCRAAAESQREPYIPLAHFALDV